MNAETYELLAIRATTGFDPARQERLLGYKQRVFDAFTMICDTDYRLGDATPVAVPASAGPVRREDVCSDEWVVDFLQRSLRIATDAQNAPADERRASVYRQAAEEERSIEPPPAGVALSVLFTFYYDEMADYWDNPVGPYPQVDVDNATQLLADADLIWDAYEAICGDVETPTT